MNDIASAIRQLAKGTGETACLVCTVDSVDYDARTVDCTPLNEGAPLLGVNLQANQNSTFGLVAFPRVGSYVVVGFVAEGSAGIVLLTDDIESLQLVISDSTTQITADENGLSVNVGDNISAVLSADNIIFNGGSLGGLVKIEELTERLNIIENDINTLKTVFSSWTPVSQDGGAALKTNATSWAADSLTPTTRDDYENDLVQQ